MLRDTQQAAEFLGLKPRTLEVWRMRGEGPPHIRLGSRTIRYLEADLQEWLESKRRVSTSHADD
jgi:predicted DNA-binding transcriptional regulator AlpA